MYASICYPLGINVFYIHYRATVNYNWKLVGYIYVVFDLDNWVKKKKDFKHL